MLVYCWSLWYNDDYSMINMDVLYFTIQWRGHEINMLFHILFIFFLFECFYLQTSWIHHFMLSWLDINAQMERIILKYFACFVNFRGSQPSYRINWFAGSILNNPPQSNEMPLEIRVNGVIAAILLATWVFSSYWFGPSLNKKENFIKHLNVFFISVKSRAI